MLHVALFEPEIAGNTGSVARTCLAVGAKLHLIRPLGYRLTDDALKRSGMDYWHELDTKVHASFAVFKSYFAHQFEQRQVYSLTTKSIAPYSQITFKDEDVLLFGPESRGLPESIRNKTKACRIPMTAKARSLNLAVSAAVVIYEASRQLGFPSLK